MRSHLYRLSLKLPAPRSARQLGGRTRELQPNVIKTKLTNTTLHLSEVDLDLNIVFNAGNVK